VLAYVYRIAGRRTRTRPPARRARPAIGAG